MSGDASSSIILLAKRIARLRLWLMPHNSLREWFYVRVLRPVIFTILGSRRQQVVARRAEAQILLCDIVSRADVQDILVIKVDHVGDFFLALQSFQILKDGFPNARLHLMCGPWNLDLATQSGFFSTIYSVNIFSEISGSGKNTAFDPKIVEEFGLPEFDIAVDLKTEIASRFLLGLVRAKFKAGYEDIKINLADPTQGDDLPVMDFTMVLPSTSYKGIPNQGRHAQTLMATLASGIVAYFDSLDAAPRALKAYDAIQPDVVISRMGQGPIIGINTGAGSETRVWPLQSYREIIRPLIEQHDATIVLLGAGYQEKDATYLMDGMPTGRFVNAIGKVSLVELPAIIGKLDLYIGHDTGGTHLAALSGQKTLCLYAGMTAFECFGPVGYQATVLKVENLPCSPCGITKLKDCSNGHACMLDITPTLVLASILSILGIKRHDRAA